MKSGNGRNNGPNTFRVEETSKYLELLPSALKKEIRQLADILGQEWEDLCSRSQSIITRSEIELFGTSSPRFATRIYFEGGGFANCRRLGHLRKNIPRFEDHSFGNRFPNGTIDESSRNEVLKNVEYKVHSIDLPEKGCIADCLLRLPDRLVRHNFFCIEIDSSKLFRTYTEEMPATDEDKELNECTFTPYVKSIRLGGGQCAQAACFVATMCLSTYAKSLCGISEITAYAHNEKCMELSLSGLTPLKMDRYFNHVGLKMCRQRLFSDQRASLSSNEKQRLAVLLRCYLRSNMPIILPVDCHKMAKIYEDNGIKHDKPIDKYQPHVVILVGQNRSNDDFVFHDPGCLPYMSAELAELGNIGCRRDGKSKDLQDNGVFMPVTPAAVSLTLGWEGRQRHDDDDIVPYFGLQALSELFHAPPETQATSHSNSTDIRIPFILAKSMEDKYVEGIEEILKGDFISKVNNLISMLKEYRGWGQDRWLWFEFRGDGVWIWDAEAPTPRHAPETLNAFSNYLLGVVKVDKNEKSVQSFKIGK